MLIRNIKRTAAILLMICFVLPLSRCEQQKLETVKSAASSAKPVQTISVRTLEDRYAYRNVSADRGWESAITIATFFWPLIIFAMVRGRIPGFRMIIAIGLLELLLCAGSAYVVYGLVLFGELRYGGYLTFLALGVYASASLAEMFRELWPLMRLSRTAD